MIEAESFNINITISTKPRCSDRFTCWGGGPSVSVCAVRLEARNRNDAAVRIHVGSSGYSTAGNALVDWYDCDNKDTQTHTAYTQNSEGHTENNETQTVTDGFKNAPYQLRE